MNSSSLLSTMFPQQRAQTLWKSKSVEGLVDAPWASRDHDHSAVAMGYVPGGILPVQFKAMKGAQT